MSRQAQLVLLLEIMITYLLVQPVWNFLKQTIQLPNWNASHLESYSAMGFRELASWINWGVRDELLVEWSMVMTLGCICLDRLIWVLTWNLVMSVFKLDWPLKYHGQKGKLNPDYNILWSQRKWRCRDAYSSGSTPKSIVSDFCGHIYFYNSWMHVNVRILFKSLYYNLFQPSIKVEPSSRNRVWHKHARANMDCGKNNPYYQEHPTFLSYYQHA